jgi:hypothetical protein
VQDHKRCHVNFYYLPWTGNEDGLEKLHRLIRVIEYELEDWCIVQLDIDIRFSEAAVDEHVRIHSPYTAFDKVTGTMRLPPMLACGNGQFQTFREFLDNYWDENYTPNIHEFISNELDILNVTSWFT